MKRVIVFGAGAIGSVIGAALVHKLRNQLVLIGREGFVKAVKKNGLRLEKRVHDLFHPQVKEKVDWTLEDTLVILTTKATGITQAITQLKPFLHETTSFLLLQNGYGIRQCAHRVLQGSKVKGENVFVGTVAFGATVKDEGVVEYYGGNIRLQEGFFNSDYGKYFDHTFMNCQQSKDIEQDIWIKLVINCIVNPLTALLRVPNNQVTQDGLNGLKNSILQEALAVARAKGLDLTMDVEFVNRFVTSENRSSMFQDVERKRETEIDFLNGALVNLAEEAGIDVPVNRFIVDLIKGLENIYLT